MNTGVDWLKEGYTLLDDANVLYAAAFLGHAMEFDVRGTNDPSAALLHARVRYLLRSFGRRRLKKLDPSLRGSSGRRPRRLNHKNSL